MKQAVYLIAFLIFTVKLSAQSNAEELKAYANYNFVAGEKTIFEDVLLNAKDGSSPENWNMEGGEAIVASSDSDKYISIKQYYTVMSPKFDAKITLPDTFTLEYDTWLDAGYDGNPGVEIHLMQGEQTAVITPNATYVSCIYPGGEQNGDTPLAIRGEKFYNIWNHISILYAKPSLTVYVDQFKMFNIPDCNLDVDRITVTGNTSQEMKILMKNFRTAKNIPSGNFEKQMEKGVFITHAIRFDVNKAVIKPESMTVLNEVAKYLKTNKSVKMEIGGYTDSDGDDASNLKLSQNRADAVKQQLVSMGVSADQLTAKGYGESKPIEPNTTAQGKAENRRVEFIKI